MVPRRPARLIFFALALSLPSAASAVLVDITYSISGGFNSSALLGGLAPTGGQATVRWGLTSLNGTLAATPFASIRSIRLSNGSGTTSLGPVLASILTNTNGATSSSTYGRTWRARRTNTGPFAAAQVVLVASNYPGPPATPFGFTQANFHSVQLFISGMSNLLGFPGQEVSRALVPEPSTAPLAALGLLVLGGYAARRRVRRRSKRA